MEKTEKTERKRKPGTFAPGNPGGGRKKMPEEIKKAFRDLVPESILTLTKILRSDESKDSDKIKVVEVILDRALGKAVQALEHTGKDGEALILKVIDGSQSD